MREEVLHMAYNENSLTRLKALKDLAQRINTNFATKTELNTLTGRVDGLVATGGEPNTLESVKVNGSALTITDKAVDITVPTNVSELTNDSNYQSSTEVSNAIATAIAAAGHASFEKADSVPDPTTAQENVMYLVMNSKTKHYDIYAKVGEEVVLLDDTTVDLTNYVEKVEGHGLYPDEDKTKLAGISAGATKVTATEGNSSINIDGTDIKLFDIASDAEVTEMLDEVFSTAVA